MYAYPALPSAAHPAPAPTAAGGGDDADLYGTLDLGHQTQLNDDLVRSLRDESAALDAALRAASAAVQAEERSRAQLGRDCACARGEMAERRRGAAEVLDAEALDEDVRGGFKDQFEGEVRVHVVSPGRGEEEAEEEQEGGRAVSHAKAVRENRAAAKAKAAGIRSIQDEIGTTRKKVRAMDDEAAGYVADATARQLDQAKAEGERQVEAKRREKEAESQRGRGVREAVQAARANSGAHAQKIAEKAKEQMTERGSHVSKETALTSLHDAKGQEVALVQAEEKKLDVELAALAGQLDFLVKQAAEFEAERTRSDAMKVEAEAVKGEIAAQAVGNEAKAKDAEASDAALKSVVEGLEEATKAVADAAAEKAANDAATVEAFEPATARKAEAMKEKERLAGEVVALQTSIEEARNDAHDAAAAVEAKNAERSSALKEETEQLERARAALAALEATGANDRGTLAEELREYRDFAAKFEAATRAEIDRLSQLKRQRIDARVEQLEGRRAEIAALEDAHRGDVDNLKECGAFLIESRELKARMEQREIILDEYGEEIGAVVVEDDRDEM